MCFLLTSISVLLLPLIQSFTWIIICASLFALFSGASVVLVLPIIIDALGRDLFSLAFGYHNTFVSFGAIAGGPAAGTS